NCSLYIIHYSLKDILPNNCLRSLRSYRYNLNRNSYNFFNSKNIFLSFFWKFLKSLTFGNIFNPSFKLSVYWSALFQFIEICWEMFDNLSIAFVMGTYFYSFKTCQYI